SNSGITSPIATTTSMRRIVRLQRSVQNGVLLALSSSSPIGNSSSPLGARNIRWNAAYTCMMTAIIKMVPPIPRKIKYGSQPSAVALSPYVEYDVLLGEPINPTRCIEIDISDIPIVQRIVVATPNLFIAGVNTRFEI